MEKTTEQVLSSLFTYISIIEERLTALECKVLAWDNVDELEDIPDDIERALALLMGLEQND